MCDSGTRAGVPPLRGEDCRPRCRTAWPNLLLCALRSTCRRIKGQGVSPLSSLQAKPSWRDCLASARSLMKIAQVSPLYESVPPKLYGGTERVVSYLTEELVRQ